MLLKPQNLFQTGGIIAIQTCVIYTKTYKPTSTKALLTHVCVIMIGSISFPWNSHRGSAWIGQLSRVTQSAQSSHSLQRSHSLPPASSSPLCYLLSVSLALCRNHCLPLKLHGLEFAGLKNSDTYKSTKQQCAIPIRTCLPPQQQTEFKKSVPPKSF